ncbi:hypothetical protein ACSTB0_13680, partial [Faecalibacterium wellingii]
MLDRENATVTICNSRTRDLPALCSAGSVAEVGIGEYSGQRSVCDAVNVLFRSQSRTHSAVVKL